MYVLKIGEVMEKLVFRKAVENDINYCVINSYDINNIELVVNNFNKVILNIKFLIDYSCLDDIIKV